MTYIDWLTNARIDVDIRRTSHRPGHLLIRDQLRHLLLRAAFHRCYELRLDVYVLRDLGAFVYDYGRSDAYLGEDVEVEV